MTPPVPSRPTRQRLTDGGEMGRWWHTRDGRIVCDLCPRACNLKPGDQGFCFVRGNVNGAMVLSTYGKSTGFCVDPVEKKPLNHFYPGTSVLSFGTAGCNLGCKFCQNWSISKSREIAILCQDATPTMIAEAATRLGCHSVAYTYNDPIIWAEYAIDTAAACHRYGLKNIAVTSGYICPQARVELFADMDAVNVDLKAFTERFYRRLTLSHLQPVLDTLLWLKRVASVWMEITNLVIPGENDSAAEIREMCEWIVDQLGPEVPIHFTAFHPAFRLRRKPPTPARALVMAHDIAKQAGLYHVYTGNIVDSAHQSTYCPGCGKLLIERRGYDITRYHMNQNRCLFCEEEISGCFGYEPGSWGTRFVPVDPSRLLRELASGHGEAS